MEWWELPSSSAKLRVAVRRPIVLANLDRRLQATLDRHELLLADVAAGDLRETMPDHDGMVLGSLRAIDDVRRRDGERRHRLAADVTRGSIADCGRTECHADRFAAASQSSRPTIGILIEVGVPVPGTCRGRSDRRVGRFRTEDLSSPARSADPQPESIVTTALAPRHTRSGGPDARLRAASMMSSGWRHQTHRAASP